MAVYSRLSLAAGGGIISTKQQASQAKNTATILIGLGGTGVDCLRTIKTQVYNRLIPDNIDNAGQPEYNHIQFLGIDTTEDTRGGGDCSTRLPLDNTEFFSIANTGVGAAIVNPLTFQRRDEMKWLEYDKIDVTFMGGDGAGGLRQAGRFMLMDQSDTFLNKIEAAINKAKIGLNNPKVYVHIFAGLSGGTGSGCFLDVCYMVKHKIKELGGRQPVFGYFFMPDVNLSRIGNGKDDVKKFIKKNGYAAMQELDYCMGLPKNGGSFEQVYKGKTRIKWNEPPVEMCHLISATNAEGDFIDKAYDYAMNVTAEYILDFLTAPENDADFGLQQHLANFNAIVGQKNAEKTHGTKMNYSVIGASSASLPLKEINTYLASKLFEKFSKIGGQEPRQKNVEVLAISALANGAEDVDKIYDYLMREMRDGAGNDYSSYPDDWKTVIGDNNKAIIRHYKDQNATKIGQMEYHAKSMMTADNALSLIGRIRAELEDILKDVNRGPIYGHKMLSAAESHNLLNLIDGLIKVNKEKQRHEANQAVQRQKDYDDSWDVFNNRIKSGLFESDQKRFERYEWFLMLYVQHELDLTAYKIMDEVLRTFKKQVENAANGYYLRLSRVMGDLLETFEQNRNALQDETVLTQDAFSEPLMTIIDLKETLDDEVNSLNIDGVMNQFMTAFIDNESAWIGGDENRISRLVNDFFVNKVFTGFAGRTITKYLKAKYAPDYGELTDAALADIIYNDWMIKLTSKANPLFAFNDAVCSVANTDKIAFLSVPKDSAPIIAAAKTMEDDSDSLWKTKASASTDRIFVMCSACGIPIAAYRLCEQYEEGYFSDRTRGRHYYEGRPITGCKFSDWRELPSIRPRSIIDIDSAPEKLKEMLCRTDAVYQRAKELKVLDDEGYLCRPKTEELEKLKHAYEQCKEKVDKLENPSGIDEVNTLLEAMRALKDLNMEKTEHQLPQEGDRETQDKIEILDNDFFTAFPVYKIMTEEIIGEFESLMKNIEELQKTAEVKIEKVRTQSKGMDAYCDALFTGVITVKGRVISYEREDAFLDESITLSKYDDAFPFGAVPVYQGYLSYLLLDSEVQEEMKALVNERKNSDDPEIQTNGQMLKEFLAQDKVKGWATWAADKEEKVDIIDFLKKLTEKFRSHCNSFGIK